MLLRSLAWKDVGPLKGYGSLDLTSLPRLVAIVGPNGSGKSHLLGMFPAALDRAMPQSDTTKEGASLVSLATSRDSYVEVEITADRPYRIRHLVDAVSGKSEALLVDAQGDPILPTTKVTDFDRWRAERLPPREVILTSLYAAQGSGGFLDLTPGERKGIILRALGLSRYERLAEEARARRETAKTCASTAEANAARERPHADVAAAAACLQDARGGHGQAGVLLDRARSALAARKDAHAAALSAAREGEAAAKRHRDALARVATARAACISVYLKVGTAEALLKDRETIERAVRRVAELAASIGEATAAARVEEEKATAADADAHAAEREAASARARQRTAGARVAGARVRLKDRAEVEAAAAALPRLRELAEEAAGRTLAARAAVDAARDTHVAGKDERIAGLRGGLSEIAIAWKLTEARARASEVLAKDDAAVDAAAAAPATLAAAMKAFSLAEEAERISTAALRSAEVLAARALDLEAAALEEVAAVEEAERASVEAADAEVLRSRAVGRAAEHRTCAAAFGEHVAAWEKERQGLAPLAAKAEALAAAAVRLEELRPALAAAEAEVAAAEEALTAAPDPGAVPAVPDLAVEERAVKEAEAALAAAATEVGKASARLDAAEAAAASLAAAEEALEEARVEASDWNRIAEDLGRNGIQALMVDAAGPELTAIVNDLLREAFGPRYTVTIETTRPRAEDGAPMEVFDLRVLDTGNGWEGSAAGLSGGQRVIVGEALRLALTTLAARRSGVRDCTLVRDEAGAALDTEAAPAWVAMLRRAADLVGARQVLIVSHDPAVAALCDARVRVEAGRVEVLP